MCAGTNAHVIAELPVVQIVACTPARAEIAVQASKLLTSSADGTVDSGAVAVAASMELAFGSNNKASAGYRQAMCQVLVKRAIEEVLA